MAFQGRSHVDVGTENIVTVRSLHEGDCTDVQADVQDHALSRQEWLVREGPLEGSRKVERISHVFEVQRKGNVDAALAKLKRAYDAQRSRPFLVVASERDTNRAERQLSLARTGPFHEIGQVTTILSFEQLRSLHRALTSVEAVLANFFDR